VNPDVLVLVNQRNRSLRLRLRDVFTGESESRSQAVRMSTARIARAAQRQFELYSTFDPRDLKRALEGKLRRKCDDNGIEYETADLRRAIDMIALMRPHVIDDAIKAALAEKVDVRQDEPIPEVYRGPAGLESARKGAYGVFPHGMNKPERAFAELLDGDDTGTVKWWLRNPANASWAVQLVLPNGRHHFPDFVVGVAGRPTPEGIALLEIKDDGMTGRLHARVNSEKIRTEHRTYKSVLWVYPDEREGRWYRAEYHSRGTIQAGPPFEMTSLKWTAN
ncbi:MAG: hypothetical protein HQL36_06785, partial [Alphaproteobacteria bacterium]|nr:hypothetical protein [Alphaproteobacteria bacterium]